MENENSIQYDEEQWDKRLDDIRRQNREKATLLLTNIKKTLHSFNVTQMLPIITHMAYYVTEDEDMHERNFVYYLRELPIVHFLCGLVLQFSNNEEQKPDVSPKGMYDLIEDSISYLIKTNPLSSGEYEESTDIDKFFVIQGHKQTSRMTRPINPERYPYQTKNFIHEIDKRVADIFVKKFGIAPIDFYRTGDLIRTYTENKINRILENKLEHHHIKNFLNDEDSIFHENIQTLADDKARDNYYDFYCRYLISLSAIDALLFSSDDIVSTLNLNINETNILNRYLALCSCESGSQAQESDVLIDNALLSKPLIRWESLYYCPAPADLTSALPIILEKLLNDEKRTASRVWDRFQKAKANILEDKAQEFLRRIFPEANVYKNIFYEYEGNIEEVDILVPFDNKLLVVQAKSGSLNDAARRGAEESFKRAIKKLIEDAFQQGVKVRNYIQNTPAPIFKQKDGTIVFAPNSDVTKKIDYIFVNLTLEPLGILSAKIRELRTLGFLKEGEYLISMTIHDLETITEILPPSPSVFIHYLKERLKAHNENLLHFQDELTAFGWYLDSGGIRKPPEFETVDWVAFDMSFVHKFDDYYLRKGPKPELMIDQEWLNFIMHIERMPCSYRSEITARLLNMSDQMREGIIDRVKKIYNKKAKSGRIGITSLAAINEPVGFTFIIIDSDKNELDEKLNVFCLSRKYQAQKNEWIGFAKARRSNGPWWKATCVQFHNFPWAFNPRMENIGKSFLIKNQ